MAGLSLARQFAADMSSLRASSLLRWCSGFALAAACACAPVALADDDRSTEARRKPDSAERRCLAARRRVERQQENVAQVDERIARVTTAQAACSGKRECERDRRAFEAAIARKQHYLKQLARLQQEAKDACPAMP